jgi:carboxyl-terminal processing protease
MKHFQLISLKVLTALGLLSLLLSFNTAISQSAEAKMEIQKLATVMQIIDFAYVDSVELSTVIDEAIYSSLKELDPHSSYIPKEEVEKTNEPLEGSFEGIGVTFQLLKDTILVIAPVEGGPSEQVGIMAGDKIVRIDGENATGEDINNQWVMDHLRGAKGTKVDVGIIRRGKKNIMDFTITRDKIPLNSIDATFMLDEEIGYIKLNRFSKTSAEEFAESVNELKTKGMSDLILDLRGNSGGYLGIAIELADEFLPFGKLIVYTEGLKSPRQEFDATPLGDFERGRLVILIDEGSASASEIVSGAVQDWDRGLIMGRRSFGKGLVQRPFNLPDGSIVRLTTARYYTPSGRSIQKPYENGREEYMQDLFNRYKHGELIYADSIKFPDSLKYSTENGRTVYGGGGIMPDVFIPWDSTWFSDYYSDLRRSGVINRFALEYVDENRSDILKEFPVLGAFKSGFNLDQVMMDGFFDMAAGDSIEYDETGWEASGELIQYQIKAMIARNIWNISAYYEVMWDIDDVILQARQVLKDGKYFKKFNLG